MQLRLLGGDRGVVFADGERCEQAVDVLHVRDIAAETEDGLVVELAETLDVWKSGERAV